MNIGRKTQIESCEAFVADLEARDATIATLRAQLARQAEQIAGLTKERDSLRTSADALAGACEAVVEFHNNVWCGSNEPLACELARRAEQALANYRTRPGGPGRGEKSHE